MSVWCHDAVSIRFFVPYIVCDQFCCVQAQIFMWQARIQIECRREKKRASAPLSRRGAFSDLNNDTILHNARGAYIFIFSLSNAKGASCSSTISISDWCSIDQVLADRRPNELRWAAGENNIYKILERRNKRNGTRSALEADTGIFFTG